MSQINSPFPQQETPGLTVQREDMVKEDSQPVQTSLEISTIQRDEMPSEQEDSQPVQAKLESGSLQRDEMPTPEEEDSQPFKLS